MNAMSDVAVIKTAAETALADAFGAARTRLPRGRAIAAPRREAVLILSAREVLPHPRFEDGKYTDLRALMRDAKPLAGPPDAAARARARDAGATLASIEGRRVVLVDGMFVPELSDLAGLEGGLRIRSMAQALTEGD